MKEVKRNKQSGNKQKKQPLFIFALKQNKKYGTETKQK
jgi:hypothetical protein